MFFFQNKEDVDKISISSSDSQLSAHLQGDSESEASDYDLETKVLTDDNVQAVRYKKKERCYVYVLFEFPYNTNIWVY